ncbi:MAG: carboxypeptidase-like regulatory domain-containing protein [Flavobacteriaceae bacterium]|nr:carboxypeptidase-like regulatory domain-containing protein [Flavobacteriaceae bacterium]
MKNEILNKTMRFFISSLALILLFGYINVAHATNLLQDNILQDTQSYTEFKGIVFDSKTKEPLIFADITVNSTNIRTVTNKEGKFLLKVTNNLLDKMITVSFLGYETRKISLSDLNNKNNKIALNVSITELSQVKINIPKDAETLVRMTLNTKGENYYNEAAIMTAFYRETIKKRKKNASLSEAVVEIYKQPYASNKNDAIKLIKSRKNTNYSRLDTLALKLQGGPFSTLYADIVKYPKYIFTEDTFPYYEFSFEPSTQINNRQVYVVKFKQLPNVVSPFYYGKLFIDSETFALTSAVYNLNVENREQASKLFLRKKPRKVTVYPTQAAYRVDYKTTNGKWYYGYSNIQLAFKVKWKNKLFSSNYTLNIEMAITDWEKNTTGKIKPKNSLKPTVILSDEASGFSDPEFWGKYNIIEPEKSIESAIRKIAKQLKRVQS